MISAKQDAALLTYFLLEIRRMGATVPYVTVTDYSRAILVALARAFSDCADLKHYLQRCYDIVIKNEKSTLPASYLRLDVSHVIKIVGNWECLRHLPNKIRQFYLRCISQAYKMQSLEELYSLLISLLVVALSEEIGYRDDDSVPAEKCLQVANNFIKGIHVEDFDVKHEMLNDFDIEETPLSWQKWSDDMYNKANDLALKSQNGNVINAFYNPTAAKKIKSLIQNLPLWTGIMRPYFKSGAEIATSSSVESLFAEYKTRLFKGCIPMRVDKFIISHLDYLDGRLRLDFASNATEQDIRTSPKQNETNSFDHSDSVLDETLSIINEKQLYNSTDTSDTKIDDSHDTKIDAKISDSSYSVSNESCCLNFKENWMGLTTKDVKKSGSIKKESYLDKCPEWDSIESQQVIFIPVVKNGNLCQPIKLKGETIMVRNTCAFDALLHITVHMIGMNPQYKRIVEAIDDCFFQIAIKIASRGKVTKNEYVERASFLVSLSLFQQAKYTRRFQSIDAMCNAAHLAEHVFLSVPSLERNKICTLCNYTNNRKFTAVSVNVDILLNKGLQHIQESINDTNSTKQTCPKCNNPCTIIEK